MWLTCAYLFIFCYEFIIELVISKFIPNNSLINSPSIVLVKEKKTT